MKDNYRRLKRAILFRTLLLTILTVAVGYGILTFFVDGIFQDSFIVMMTGFSVLLLIFFYISIGRMTKYLDDISDSLEKLLSGSEEPIVLVPELEPMAEKMVSLKTELVRREKQAAESEKKKNELVVYLAHDLKTPLTAVIAYLTMLDEHPDMSQENRVKYTHITLEKAIRLEELINEFFDITRLNLQNLVLEKEELDLSILLEQIADESYGMLSEKKMTCAVDVEENLMVQGDPDKLARVFDNLLRNAAAYGYENTEILIQARGGDGRITIIFKNEGPQIPPKKLDMIFEKFYRVDDARSGKTGGAGLGLAIAKQIVELHGGAISATSDYKTTRFIVTLPSEHLLVEETGKNAEKDSSQSQNRPQKKAAVGIFRKHK